jgi:hypothetical protein
MMSFPLPSLGGRISKFGVVFLIILGLWGLMAEAAPAQVQQASQVKAAFLYNFAKFVEWPPGTFADDRTAITLGFFDEEPMAGALEALQGKVVQGRRLEVKRSRSIEEVRKCQIFFVSTARKAGLPQILGALKNSPVLIVTDEVDNFAKLGGIINFIIVEDKIHFEICVENARQAGLNISSQLLKLAKLING